MLQLTEKLKAGEALSPADINLATTDLISEDVDSNGKADFLTAFAEKGESAEEIASFAREFIDLAVKPDLDSASLGKPIIDVCGTGGDKLDLFNVSTTSVFLLAAAGVAVVKHGNRGITSKSGGADALEALGIRIDLPSEQFGECVASVGAGFLFAPMYHPAFKAVVPVRKALAEKGQRTVFNLLGPLLNPVDPDYQLIGIFDGSRGADYANILSLLGRKRAWAAHGSAGESGGMDEISTLGPTRIWETRAGQRRDFSIDPSDLGISKPILSDLQGGEAAENAEIIRGILDGSLRGPKRDLAALNCAAALTICDRTDSLASGWQLANEVLDSGNALHVLEQWKAFA